jgi:glycerol-3-phosphate acyltransferase PlsX
MLKTIALDAMGGDYGPEVVVPAAIEALNKHPNVELILVGQETSIRPLLKAHSKQDDKRLLVHHASEVVEMSDSPASALRGKKDSSMRIALDLVKERKALACVSAGNTGALMALARHVLRMIPGIDRPAIVTAFPTHRGKEVRLLDLGANVDSTPENLYQFAIMGTILSAAVNDLESPRVGLLNIGEEDIKGNELVKKAAELLSNNKAINYVGYVEGDKLFEDVADVVVCDGFVGNVTLKTIEGAVKLIYELAREEIYRNIFTKLLVAPAKPILKRMVKRLDPESHNGATLLGLDGIVVKSHGSASARGFAHAIEEAIIETEKNVPDLIKQRINSFLTS